MRVRHLVLEGSQEAIGAALTELARDELGVEPWRSKDERVTRLQAAEFAHRWPSHAARMRGSAAAFGVEADDWTLNLSSLAFHMDALFGCSVVHLPPALTAEPGGLVSRNLDFTTGNLFGRRVGPGEPAALSRPFVVESYPDEGYASLFTCSMDLLGGAFDGVNEHGLVAALLTDRELMNEHEMEPTRDQAVGINEIQLVRFLLETCRDVDEAKDALLSVKHTFAFVPCHYLVADASGRSFVFEMSASRNTHYFFEARREPLVTTNFMRHNYRYEDVPPGRAPKDSFGRYHALHAAMEGATKPVSAADLPALHACADQDDVAPPPQVPFAAQRTMWHAVYDPAARSLSIDFYLGEDAAPNGAPRLRRSGALGFALRPGAGR